MLISVLQFALPYAILVLVVMVWIRLIGLRSPLSVLPMYALVFALSWFVIAVLWRVTWRPRVVRALRELGYDVCTKCGYWLKGLDDSIDLCPECGAARTTRSSTGAELDTDPSPPTSPSPGKET